MRLSMADREGSGLLLGSALGRTLIEAPTAAIDPMSIGPGPIPLKRPSLDPFFP